MYPLPAVFRVTLAAISVSASVAHAAPLPIDPLWQSEIFRKSITASYGIDSRIEPRITEDEAFYLDAAAKAMAEQDRAKAIATLAESSLLAESPAMLFTLASHEFEAEKVEDSMKHFEAALSQFPNFRDAHRNYAVVLVQSDKLDQAKAHLVRALELGAQDGLTAGLLAYCHAHKGHHQAALDAYRLALLTQPDESQWQMGAVQALVALKHSREAASMIEALLEKSPADTQLWLLKADTFADLDDPAKSAAHLEVVHRAGALSPDATLSLGHLYLQNDLPELAFERYRAAITAPNPAALSRAVEAVEMFLNASDWTRGKEVATWIDLADAYRAQLDPEKGEKKLISRLTRARAMIELEAGDRAAGAERLEQWLRSEPLDGPCLVLLARFRSEAGKRPEAEMLLEQAARVPDSAAAAHLDHGRLLVAAGDYEEALEHLRKSQELNPSSGLADYVAAIEALTK